MNNTSNNSSGEQEPSHFSSPQEEIAFLRRKLEETQTEFLEFQESSRELELEFETQVKQLEKTNNDYMNQVAKLDLENDQLKSKYSVYANDTQHKLNEYQEQISELQSINTRLTSYIRELEQNNDDLERARRALAASLEDFEVQLNQQIERNVLLENEVSEKEELECVVQRLKEESRDLKHELIAKQTETAKKKQLMLDSLIGTSKSQPADSSLISNISHNLEDPQDGSSNSAKQPGQQQQQQIDKAINSSHNSSKQPLASTDVASLESPSHRANGSDRGISGKPTTVDSTTSPLATPSHFTFSSSPSSPPASTDSKSQQTSTPSSPTMPAMVMSPSTRISALNIVSDLLRKVLSLESKLASAKKATD